MIRVKKISHVIYETPDLMQQTEYYANVLGLTRIEKGDGAVYLGSKIDPHSVVLKKGAQAQCTTIGFQLAHGEDLEAFGKQVAAHGIKVKSASDPEPGIAKAVSFDDFKGTGITVFTQDKPGDHAFSGKGIQPHKLGHIAFHVADVKACTDWYCNVLGMRVSDWMADFFSFLRCDRDHHTINLVGTGQNAHFHTAFELRDWSHMQTAADLLSQNGYKIIWGPGRHGIGHNLFTYHRGPNGLINELFCELDQIADDSIGLFEPRPWHRDNPQMSKVWPKGPASANLWGPPPPDEMMKL
jgi:catechol 2,3-dioxygenase-like lactoylglutathione lyase family enzyme